MDFRSPMCGGPLITYTCGMRALPNRRVSRETPTSLDPAAVDHTRFSVVGPIEAPLRSRSLKIGTRLLLLADGGPMRMGELNRRSPMCR